MARIARVARARTGLGAERFDVEKMATELGVKDSRTQRVAYYLDWAARHFAFQYQPYNVIA